MAQDGVSHEVMSTRPEGHMGGWARWARGLPLLLLKRHQRCQHQVTREGCLRQGRCLASLVSLLQGQWVNRSRDGGI